MEKKQKLPKVVHRKLGKEKAYGLAWKDKNKIEIDERLSGYRYMLVVLHEHYHIQHPEWSESMVANTSSKTARLLWELGFRWCDLGKNPRY